ncbi:MAG: PAS domain S-box protein [Methanoregula sp.]|nr:PAS domain S-box protein [Methanoregula sp.]
MAAQKKEGPEKKGAKPTAGTRAMREAAEKKLGELRKNIPNLAGQTPEQIVHELLVHQIELEMQAEELRRSHLELSESRDKLLDLYDFAPNGYITLSDKALIKEVNLAGALLLGVERSRLVRARFRKFIAPHDLSLWDRYFTNILDLEEKQKCTLTLIRGDKSLFPARLESIRIPGRDGEITVRITISDITDIWQIGALRESEERFRKIFENSPIGMVLVTPDFRFFSVNPAWVAMTGYAEKELLKISFTDVTHPDHLTGDREHMRELVAGTIAVYQTEKRYIRKDGSILWGLIRVTPIRDPRGSLVYFAAQIEDITEWKNAEKALRENEVRFRLLFENSPVPYQSLDAAGRFLEVNESWLTMLGYRREEVIGHWFGDFIATNFSEIFRTNFPRFKEAGETHVEFRMKRKDGSLITVAFDGKIGHYPDGSFRQTHCVFRDITRQKAADEALKESEEKYRTLVSSVDAGIILQSTSGRILTWNPAAERVFGESAENVLEHRATGIKWCCVREDGSPFPAEEHPSMVTLLTGKPLRNVIMGVTSSTGRFSWISINTTPLFHDGESAPHAVVISFSDITERKTAEDALKESEKVLGDIIEKNPLSIQIVDTDGFTLNVNPAHTRLFGSLPPPDFSIFADLVKKQPALESLIQRARSGEVVNLPDIYFNVHDSYPEYPDVPVWVRAVIFPLTDTSGKPDRFVLMHENITERKRAEDALKELSAYNRTLIESSIDPLVTISPAGKIQDVNIATETATGLRRDELIGTDFSEYFTEPEKAREGYLRVLSEGKVIDYPLEIRHMEGHVLPVLYNATIYCDSNGNVRGVFAAARDVTERKRAEAVRESLMQELTRKNAELDRFTHTISHDLRSPLLSIQGFLALLERDMKAGNAEKVQTDILRITGSAKKLEQLITTLLALSRSGRAVDTPLRIPFGDIVNDAARLLAATLQERGVTLVIPETLPVIAGDRHRLVQVMTNLLDNAVKFMGTQKEPLIEIGVEDDCGTPVFFVRDNGMGIAQENLQKAFGLYERFSPDIPGSGIGLATVKRIIEAHGGKIWVESEGPGKGSTFRFTLAVAV